jgi:hypothetical protein
MAEGEGPRILATFSSYSEMLEAIRARVNELQIHGERFDNFVGLPDGYFAKLVGARPIRRLGMVSFQPVLAGLGLKCQFVEDQAATNRLKNRVPPRNVSYVRADATHVVLTFRFMSARNGRAVLQSPAGGNHEAASITSGRSKRHYGGELRGLAHNQLSSQRGLRSTTLGPANPGRRLDAAERQPGSSSK